MDEYYIASAQLRCMSGKLIEMVCLSSLQLTQQMSSRLNLFGQQGFSRFNRYWLSRNKFLVQSYKLTRYCER